MKVKFFVGDDSALNTLQNQITDWLDCSGVTPVNMNSSVHYDNGWHIIVIVYYQDGPTSNLVIPRFQRVD